MLKGLFNDELTYVLSDGLNGVAVAIAEPSACLCPAIAAGVPPHVAYGRLCPLVVVILHLRQDLDLAVHVQSAGLGASARLGSKGGPVGAAAFALHSPPDPKLLPLFVLLDVPFESKHNQLFRCRAGLCVNGSYCLAHTGKRNVVQKNMLFSTMGNAEVQGRAILRELN